MNRASWWVRAAMLAFVAILVFGCARPIDLPIDLMNSDSPDSELAALVDSDAARRLLADLLARRSADARAPGAAASAHLTDLASGDPQLEGVTEPVGRLPHPDFLD